MLVVPPAFTAAAASSAVTGGPGVPYDNRPCGNNWLNRALELVEWKRQRALAAFQQLVALCRVRPPGN